MKRGRAPKRKAWLSRRTPLKQVNLARMAALNAAAFGPQADLCRSLPCCCCGAPPPSDPAHVRSRGAGGRDSDTVPLCRQCHTAQHTLGIRTFQAEHSLDLVAEAARLAGEVEKGLDGPR